GGIQDGAAIGRDESAGPARRAHALLGGQHPFGDLAAAGQHALAVLAEADAAHSRRGPRQFPAAPVLPDVPKAHSGPPNGGGVAPIRRDGHATRGHVPFQHAGPVHHLLRCLPLAVLVLPVLVLGVLGTLAVAVLVLHRAVLGVIVLHATLGHGIGLPASG